MRPLPPDATPRLRASAGRSRTRRRMSWASCEGHRETRREVRDQASAATLQAPPKLFVPEKTLFGQRVPWL